MSDIEETQKKNKKGRPKGSVKGNKNKIINETDTDNVVEKKKIEKDIILNMKGISAGDDIPNKSSTPNTSEKILIKKDTIIKNKMITSNNDNIEDKKNNSDDSNDDDDIKKKNSNLTTKIKLLEKKNKKLSESLEKYTNDDSSISFIDIDITFVDSETGKIFDYKDLDIKDLSCWWCAHEFDNLPCFIIDNYYNDKYYTYGLFCSFNCAIAKNLDFRDNRISERYNLTKKVYSILTGKNIEHIPSPPPREILAKFSRNGISIEEWRKNSMTHNKTYNIVTPFFVQTNLKCEKMINKKR